MKSYRSWKPSHAQFEKLAKKTYLFFCFPFDITILFDFFFSFLLTFIFPPSFSFLFSPVFQIHFILKWIWIRGSTSGNSGSVAGSGQIIRIRNTAFYKLPKKSRYHGGGGKRNYIYTPFSCRFYVESLWAFIRWFFSLFRPHRNRK